MATTLDPRPVKLTWPLYAGDDESIVFVVENIDVSARTYACQVRTEASSGVVAATAACSAAFVTPNTEITVSLTDVQTRALADARARYVWDLQETVGGVVSTLVGGQAIVSMDVTR